MNIRTPALALVLALAASLPAHAGGDIIEQLAAQTGLKERRVQMILGTRTSFAEYPYTYERSLRQFKRALGPERYRQLVAGGPVRLASGPIVRLAAPLPQQSTLPRARATRSPIRRPRAVGYARPRALGDPAEARALAHTVPASP